MCFRLNDFEIDISFIRKSLSSTNSMSRKGTPVSRRAENTPIQSPSTLQQCVKCNVLLNVKDKSKHTDDVCQQLSKNGINGARRTLGDTPSKNSHGFILGNKLVARLQDLELKSKDLDEIPDYYHDRLLLIHHNAFETLNLEEGESVTLSRHDSDTDLTCYNVWPHYSIRHPCSVSIYGHSEDDNNYVYIEKISDITVASVVTVTTADDCDKIELINKLKYSVLKNRCIFDGISLTCNVSNRKVTFKCMRIKSGDVCYSMKKLTVNGDPTTKYHIVEQETRIIVSHNSRIKFEDVGGLDKQIASMRELIELRLKSIDAIKKLGSDTPRGILAYGVSGSGKTMTMEALMNELSEEIFFMNLDAASVLGKAYGETESKLRSYFSLARDQQPSVVIIDDVDILCSSKKSNTDQDNKTLKTIRNILDKLSEGLLVIGITNRPESIDPSLRRSGRFDREVEFPVPLAKHRVEILQKVLANCKHNITEDNIVSLAETAYSFTGADLVLARNEATVHALKSNHKSLMLPDLEYGFKCVKPSAMREIMLEVPKVYWTDIGGMHEVKQKLKRMVVWPLTKPEIFTKLGILPSKGILMYGPPGCSKTMVGKALATDSKLNFIAIKGPELFNKYVGESERELREIFRKAKQAAPAILFFDEIDAIAVERGGGGSGSSVVGDRVLTTLLTEMDGVEMRNEVIIVAATNRPDIIDPALLRPGRLDSIIYVPLPDHNTRREIFVIKTKGMPLSFDNAPDILAELTADYSGAEISAVCHEAGQIALEADIDTTHIHLEHFKQALEVVSPRTSPKKIIEYEQYAKRNRKVK